MSKFATRQLLITHTTCYHLPAANLYLNWFSTFDFKRPSITSLPSFCTSFSWAVCFWGFPRSPEIAQPWLSKAPETLVRDAEFCVKKYDDSGYKHDLRLVSFCSLSYNAEIHNKAFTCSGPLESLRSTWYVSPSYWFTGSSQFLCLPHQISYMITTGSQHVVHKNPFMIFSAEDTFPHKDLCMTKRLSRFMSYGGIGLVYSFSSYSFSWDWSVPVWWCENSTVWECVVAEWSKGVVRSLDSSY